MVGSSNVSFWDDIWYGDRPLRDISLDDRGNPLVRVSDFWNNGVWSLPKLRLVQRQSGLPPDLVEVIQQVPILHGQQDIPRWSLSLHGNFTLASAWEIGRTRGPTIPALEDIWNKGLSASISIFIWRLLSNRIPVDAKLQWRKISLASKCLCCPTEPQSESLSHLFVQGRGASGVRREFDMWFEGQGNPLQVSYSIPVRLEIWARRAKQKSSMHLCRLIPCLIFWFLWAERNRCRHNETTFKSSNVVWQVQLHVHKLMASGCLEPKHWRGVRLSFVPPNRVSSEPARRRVLTVKWNPPDPPWIKLNTCASFAQETRKAYGGGLIRDHRGCLVLAYSTALIAHSSLEADVMAMIAGIQLAKEMGSHIWVESEASQAVALVNSVQPGPADSRHTMAKFRILQNTIKIRASFIHREGNKPAHLLAAMGLEGPALQRFGPGDLPRHIQAIIRTEQEGLPYIRVSELGRD